MAAQASIDALRESNCFTRTLRILRDNIQVVLDVGGRIARIVGTLRSFGRLDEADVQRASLEEGIESTLALMRHQIPESVKVTMSFAGLEPVCCSPGQLNQVFMSLVRNAVEAIEGEGEVDVSGDG